VLNKASVKARTDCQEQLLSNRSVTSIIGHRLFNQVWQKQRLIATAMQYYVEQSVIGYRCCHIRSLQGQAYHCFIPFLQAIKVENLFKWGRHPGDGADFDPSYVNPFFNRHGIWIASSQSCLHRFLPDFSRDYDVCNMMNGTRMVAGMYEPWRSIFFPASAVVPPTVPRYSTGVSTP